MQQTPDAQEATRAAIERAVSTYRRVLLRAGWHPRSGWRVLVGGRSRSQDSFAAYRDSIDRVVASYRPVLLRAGWQSSTPVGLIQHDLQDDPNVRALQAA